jgi:hypothetical protein
MRVCVLGEREGEREKESKREIEKGREVVK